MFSLCLLYGTGETVDKRWTRLCFVPRDRIAIVVLNSAWRPATDSGAAVNAMPTRGT